MSGMNDWLAKELMGVADGNREIFRAQNGTPLSTHSKMDDASINRSQGSPRNNNSQGDIKKPHQKMIPNFKLSQ